MTEPPITVRKLITHLLVSDEDYADAFTPPPSPGRRKPPWKGDPLTPPPAGHTRLRAVAASTAQALAAVVDLHHPEPAWVHHDGTVTTWQCAGCDWAGYEGEPPEWPCRTVTLTAEALGVDLTEEAKEADRD